MRNMRVGVLCLLSHAGGFGGGAISVFETKKISDTEIINNVNAIIQSIKDAHRKLARGGTSGSMGGHLATRWTHPEQEHIKVNVDGAYSYSTGSCGCSGLVRDEHGRMQLGFICRMEEGDNLTAELCGCLHGLRAAWDYGYRNVIFEIDSSDAVKLLTEGEHEVHKDRIIITEAQQILQREWCIEVRQIQRSANAVADYMAKKSLSIMPGFHILSQPIPELKQILDMDNG